MSKDPAFLFYDGDAAKDVSHLNRLERGCYFDLIQAQRKFGRLKIDVIKKILGKDFELCWPSLEICLTYDNHTYFIEWVEESVNKRKLYCESRRNNRLIQNKKDMSNICQTYDKHMEIEIEDKDIIKDKVENKKKVDSKHWHDQRFRDAFESFLEMRKKMKKPMTDRAKELLWGKLDKFGLDTAVAMLNQSIMHSWIGVFPLKSPPDSVIKAQQESSVPQYEINPEEQEKVSKMIKETLGNMR